MATAPHYIFLIRCVAIRKDYEENIHSRFLSLPKSIAYSAWGRIRHSEFLGVNWLNVPATVFKSLLKLLDSLALNVFQR